MANKVRDISIKIYQHGAQIAETKGIIIADTKMEFGVNCEKGEPLFSLTNCSLRTHHGSGQKDKYQPGRGQESFDKQFVRDYLLSINFNKKPPRT